jgi:hypothetical protein
MRGGDSHHNPTTMTRAVDTCGDASFDEPLAVVRFNEALNQHWSSAGAIAGAAATE